jgi:hypothetical protein
LYFTPALILTFFPEEKEQQLHVSGFAADCPANTVARNFKQAANDSRFLSLAHRMGEGGRRPGEGLILAGVRADV